MARCMRLSSRPDRCPAGQRPGPPRLAHRLAAYPRAWSACRCTGRPSHRTRPGLPARPAAAWPARRSIGGEPPEWHPGRDRLGDHRPSLPRLDGKLRLRRDPRRPAPLRVTGPGLGTYSSGVRGPRPGDTASLERPPDRSFMVGGGMTARLTPPGVEDDPGTRSNGDLTVNGTLTGQVATSGRPFTRRRAPQGGGRARV